MVLTKYLFRDLAPGQRECERAIEDLRGLYHEVDKAITNVELIHRTDKSLQVSFYSQISIPVKKS